MLSKIRVLADCEHMKDACVFESTRVGSINDVSSPKLGSKWCHGEKG